MSRSPDAAGQRSVMDYLQAFVTDEVHLSILPHKFESDTATIANARIMMLPVGSPRKPRGVVASITTEAEVPPRPPSEAL